MRSGFTTEGFPQILALSVIPKQPKIWPNLTEVGEKVLQVKVPKLGSRQSFSDRRASPCVSARLPPSAGFAASSLGGEGEWQ